MVDYKFYCVLDEQKNYKTYVLALIKNGVEEIQSYTLQDGEILLEIQPPAQTLVKAHWNGESWQEAATEEEIQEWLEQQPPMLEPSGPSLEERISDLEEAVAMAIYGGGE